MRELKFVMDELLDGRADGMAFKLAGLLVQPPQSSKLFLPAELRLLHCGLQHLDGFVIDLYRHRERMAILRHEQSRSEPGQ
jgi:hypothetical protein